MLKNKQFPIYIERTNKHLIFGHVNVTPIFQYRPFESNDKDWDESYVTINPENVNEVYKIKPKTFNFYNKFSKISGKTIGSLISKFEFNLISYDSFNVNRIDSNDSTVDKRCYDIVDFLFTKDITKYNLVKRFNKWIDDVKNVLITNEYKEKGILYDKNGEEFEVAVRIDCFDLNLMGGTAGIVFGHDENRLPTFMTERATEYITSDKIIIKSGTLEKQMSGISKINFGQIPLCLFKDWLLIGNGCTFDTKSLTMSYRLESDKKDPNGVTFIEFKFVPIDTDTFYKNVTMFETQNRFFKWAINSATNDESKSNVMNNIDGIPMRLNKIMVTNNTVRESEISADIIAQNIIIGLNLGDNFTIKDKISEDSNKKITYIFTNDKIHDPNGVTECLFKAYL